MPDERKVDLKAEIGHVLLIDIVGYSKMLINEQSELLQVLKKIVRGTDQFRLAEAAGSLLRLPTGDGMALVFRENLEAPAQCALEISQANKNHPSLQLRMGIHSGPVSEVVDVNERANIAGAGINIAQRVMDCGDAGHILLSRRVAEDLASYRHWQPHLHDLGEWEVKHGKKIGVVNLYTGELGNSATPENLAWKREAAVSQARRRRTFAWLSVAVGLTIALSAGWILFSRRTPPKTSAEPVVITEKRIAVLPFKPLVPANGDQVLELGMADSLITKLSNSRELIVSSLPSVRKYGGLEQDSLAAGRALQVNSVLEGNVQKVGDHIRVTARLLKVADGSSLWASTFDEKFTNVFAVQDTISQKVADALALQLNGEEKKRLTKRYTDNLEAYQLYLTGRYYWNRLTPVDLMKSISYFQQAIALDQSYALAYFGLADAYRALCINSDIRSKEILPKAKEAALKTIELDQALAEPHMTLAFIHLWFDWNWARAESEIKRALALNPNLAFGHVAYAQLHTALGRHPEAIAEAARARQLDPVSPIINTLEGFSLFFAARYDEAEVSLQRALELNPNLWVAHLFLGKLRLERNDYPRAIAEFVQAREFSGGGSEANSMLAYAWARAGDPTKARALLQEWQTTSAQRYLPPYNVAVVHLALAQRDESFAFLEKAGDERDVRLFLLRVDKKWDPVRSDPRFVAILKRMGLE